MRKRILVTSELSEAIAAFCAYGMSHSVIRDEIYDLFRTRVSSHQISYHSRAHGISVMDYRRGGSPAAKSLIAKLEKEWG